MNNLVNYEIAIEKHKTIHPQYFIIFEFTVYLVWRALF